jgi:hypothetical protein
VKFSRWPGEEIFWPTAKRQSVGDLAGVELKKECTTVTNKPILPNTSSVVNVKRSSSRRSQRSGVSGWLPVDQEAKLAQRFFDVAADSSVPWRTFPNSIRIVSYRNGFVVLDAEGQELFRKITGESLAV